MSGDHNMNQVYGTIGVATPAMEKTIGDYIKAIQEKVPEDKPKYNVVDKPKHYMLFEDMGIEVRDLMKLLSQQLDNEGYSGMLVSDYIQAMQYLLRWHNKNGVEDIKKSIWYLNKIIEQLESKKEI